LVHWGLLVTAEAEAEEEGEEEEGEEAEEVAAWRGVKKFRVLMMGASLRGSPPSPPSPSPPRPPS